MAPDVFALASPCGDTATRVTKLLPNRRTGSFAGIEKQKFGSKPLTPGCPALAMPDERTTAAKVASSAIGFARVPRLLRHWSLISVLLIMVGQFGMPNNGHALSTLKGIKTILGIQVFLSSRPGGATVNRRARRKRCADPPCGQGAVIKLRANSGCPLLPAPEHPASPQTRGVVKDREMCPFSLPCFSYRARWHPSLLLWLLLSAPHERFGFTPQQGNLLQIPKAGR